MHTLPGDNRFAPDALPRNTLRELYTYCSRFVHEHWSANNDINFWHDIFIECRANFKGLAISNWIGDIGEWEYP